MREAGIESATVVVRRSELRSEFISPEPHAYNAAARDAPDERQQYIRKAVKKQNANRSRIQ